MTDPGLDAVSARTLVRVAALLADTREPWWVIGSAAVALHGAPVAVTRDVDVLVGAGDMAMLAAATGVEPQPGDADGRFCSAHVLRLTDQPLTVELFADFTVRSGESWQRLWPATRQRVEVHGAALFVPELVELIDILMLFGRDKDIARAALLRALG